MYKFFFVTYSQSQIRTFISWAMGADMKHIFFFFECLSYIFECSFFECKIFIDLILSQAKINPVTMQTSMYGCCFAAAYDLLGT